MVAKQDIKNEFFNLQGLRTNYGRSRNGSNRQNIKITITPETMGMLQVVIPFGKGSYGSSLIELSIRTLLVLVSNGEDIGMIGEELNRAIVSPYFSNNLRAMASYIEKVSS